MDLANLTARVRNTAIAAAKEYRELDLGKIRGWLLNMDTEVVVRQLMAKRPRGWSGAVPTGEPVTTQKVSKHQPALVIGVDGSQIYPSMDHPVRWAYVQAALYPWTGQQPIGGQFIDIGEIERYQLIDAEGSCLNSTAYIDALRALLELEVADAAVQRHPEAVILLDNPLLPYNAQFPDAYLDFISKMRGAMLAGYVSSPRSHMIYQLLRLAYENTNYPIVSSIFDDTQIMRSVLEIGQRSTVFLYGNWRNTDFESVGAAIYYFFLKLSEHEIARVEIPSWIAHSPDTLDLIHSSIMADSREYHYPNALLMAHNAVVVPRKLGRQLNELALREYLQHGGDYHPSAKKQAKGQ